MLDGLEGKRRKEEEIGHGDASEMWMRFYSRMKLIYTTILKQVNNAPLETFTFLHQMTTGGLSIPETYLLPLEKAMIGDILNN